MINCLQGQHSACRDLPTFGSLVLFCPLHQNLLRNIGPVTSRSLRGASGTYCNYSFQTYSPNSLAFLVHSNLKYLNYCSHVLVHLLKSLRAYIVKSSSTLFSDNIQWNLEISFSYARFNSLLGYNFLTESWDHQEWDFSDSCILKLKNSLSNVIYCFEKH